MEGDGNVASWHTRFSEYLVKVYLVEKYPVLSPLKTAMCTSDYNTSHGIWPFVSVSLAPTTGNS